MPEAAIPLARSRIAATSGRGWDSNPRNPWMGASGFKPVALDPKSRLAGASAYRRVLLDLVRRDGESARRGHCG